MPTDDRKRLASIRRFDELVAYLRDELGWPIDSDDFEELTFEYTPEELGIDAKNAARIREIKRLRPLVSGQPWGIFFVKFEPKRLPVVALRRILGQVALKKRASANKSVRQAWAADDLLFVSNYGEGESRRIAFAHFSKPPNGHDLPTLRVLGWDNLDTQLHLDAVARELTDHLVWPDDEDDTDAWRERWRSAFKLRHREVITTSKALSESLAKLAQAIRGRIRKALAIETETGPLTKLMKAFQTALVHDLDEAGFADMYAQTIAYGLLSARITDPTRRTADDFAAHMRTNPFLKELMETFLQVGGRRGKAGGPSIDIDELGVSEVVELLDQANMAAVVRDFGDRNPQEDPVIHFYEHFLEAYDKEQKVRRGVFYTPRPVVSYVVCSIDRLLRTQFGLADGLADTATWGEMAKRIAGLEIPDGTAPDQDFVQVLDPATGTGTFLVEAIDVIYRTLVEKWRAQGHRHSDIEHLWNDYVPRHLLSRLHGYELLMAPYAIAHLKIGLKLHETGYRFNSDERARVYLTNALEPAQDHSGTFEFSIPALANEARAVNEVKRNRCFSVLIGNPPYSASISEPEWIMRLLDDWKRGLNEKKTDLNREEWKFLRFAQHLCATTHVGAIGVIINRDFLDGITKRSMRRDLGSSFPLRIVIDLNGDVKGNIRDENVFEIEQGVAIALLCTHHLRGQLLFTSRVGTRKQKYAELAAKTSIDNVLTDVHVSTPYYRWVPLSPRHAAVSDEYSEWPPIKSAFEVVSSGIQTKRDALCVAFTNAEMWERIQRFHALPVERAREEFGLGPDGRDWSVGRAKADVADGGPHQRFLHPILYRPFDVRFTYWTGKTKGFLAYPRRDVMRHIVGRQNVGMIFNRQVVGKDVSHFGVGSLPICSGTFYLGNKGQDYFAPRRVYGMEVFSDELGRSNIKRQFVGDLHEAIGRSVPKPSAEAIFAYAYGVFHSPTYRARYAELLKIDFPRLPLPRNAELFRELGEMGETLIALHLMEPSMQFRGFTTYKGSDSPEVERVAWSGGTVWLDAAGAVARDNYRASKSGTIGFEGVPEEVWDFRVGGYQVCHKWLNDRKGRALSNGDIDHYQKIVVALNETIRIMAEIDEVIEARGGWPGAFHTASRPSEKRPALLRVAESPPPYDVGDGAKERDP